MLNLKKQTGFTLIEVMVSLVVLAVGLLGLMAVQILALKNNTNADFRSRATILAYDMAERMRANKAGFDSGNYSPTPANYTGTGCTAACSPSQMASQDILVWQADIAASLPEGTGTIATAATNATDGLDITILWEETDKSGESLDKSFILRVRNQ